VLDLKLQAGEGGSLAGLGALDSALAEVEDVVSYISDVLSLGEGGGGWGGQLGEVVCGVCVGYTGTVRATRMLCLRSRVATAWRF
jgi:hypothetical protein